VDARLPPGPSLAAVMIGAVCILLGARGFFLLERALFPWDDYVPAGAQGLLHGFRIPGGIALVALASPITARVLGLPWRQFGDATIISIPIFLAIVRVGCFLNGCCFGYVSDVPWAVSFPPGSWPFWYHVTAGWLPSDAPGSLPVHPLQLYFMFSAIAILIAILCVRSRFHAVPGGIQLLSYALFFLTSAGLELFRENLLTLNSVFLPTASLVSIACLVSLHRLQRTRPLASTVGEPSH
jgi:phosphatidylglycerol:prolipoprotein diacylglycerol transferase